MIKRIALFAVGTLIGLALLFGGVWVYRTYIAPPPLRGVAIESPRPAYDFQLQSGGDQTVRLSQFRGKVVALYFGYTFCPDVCPATLAQVSEAMKQLGGDADRVQLIMISVDPERDTPGEVQNYVQAFDPRFIGLTGDLDTLTRISTEFGVVFQKHPGSEATGYLIDHTATLTVVDRDGYARLIMPFGVAGADIASDMRYMLTH